MYLYMHIFISYSFLYIYIYTPEQINIYLFVDECTYLTNYLSPLSLTECSYFHLSNATWKLACAACPSGLHPRLVSDRAGLVLAGLWRMHSDD